MKKFLILLLLIHGTNCLRAQFPTCYVKFWNHIDCGFNLIEIGFDVDTLNSVLYGKNHYHPFSGSVPNGCWGDHADTTVASYPCGSCGEGDTDIFNAFSFPLTSKTYKSFSINFGTSSVRKMFDWNDIINYKKYVYGFPIPDDPYCCTSTIPAACSSCNCGVGMVHWKEKKVALLPAWGIYWENNCPVISNN